MKSRTADLLISQYAPRAGARAVPVSGVHAPVAFGPRKRAFYELLLPIKALRR